MQNLLVLGPLPPPLTGTPVSFEIFCEHAKKSTLIKKLIVVDSSPKFLKQQKKFEFSLRNIKQALSIIYKFAINITKADSAIIFGSNGYIVSLAPILLLIAKRHNKKCFFRAFGGSLDQYILNLSPPQKWLALTTLRNFSGVIVQTKFLREHFSQKLGNSAIHYVAGYRQPLEKSSIKKKTKRDLKLKIVFVGIVKEDKGIFVLLDAMKKLSAGKIDVELTVYGSIHEPIRNKFEKLTKDLDNTSYGGIIDWRDVVNILSHQDLLVLPTFYHSEGHPGVLIEAMMAGIPIVSTNFRSIPELVTHERNGLLVPPSSVCELTESIKRLARDRQLLNQMATINAQMSQNFTANKNVNNIIEIALDQPKLHTPN